MRTLATLATLIGLLAFLGSKVSFADEIDCKESPIQHSIEEAYTPREGGCMKWIGNAPITSIRYLRSIDTPDEFAIVVSDHVRARTYIQSGKLDKLTKLIKGFPFVKNDGTNFAEIERNKIGGKTYRTQRFDLPRDASCFGFLVYGSPHFDGYGAQAFGVFCRKFANIEEFGLDDLTRFLTRLKIRDIL